MFGGGEGGGLGGGDAGEDVEELGVAGGGDGAEEEEFVHCGGGSRGWGREGDFVERWVGSSGDGGAVRMVGLRGVGSGVGVLVEGTEYVETL